MFDFYLARQRHLTLSEDCQTIKTCFIKIDRHVDIETERLAKSRHSITTSNSPVRGHGDYSFTDLNRLDQLHSLFVLMDIVLALDGMQSECRHGVKRPGQLKELTNMENMNVGVVELRGTDATLLIGAN